MAIEIKPVNFGGSLPAFWRGEAKILPGGFQPGQTLPTGSLVRRGTPVYVNFSEMKAYICKTAKVVEVSGTAVKVAKGSFFAAADEITVDGATAKATIASVDTSNAEYDTINLSEAAAYVIAGATIYEAKAAATAKYDANAVVGADLEVKAVGIPTIDAAYDAVVIAPHLAHPVPASWLAGGMCLKNNHSVKFINQ